MSPFKELKDSTSTHAQELYKLISSQINEAEREYVEDGQVVIKIVRSNAKQPQLMDINNCNII